MAQGLGGDLASVTDMTTNRFLTTVTSSRAWIGASLNYKGGPWTWSDGTPWCWVNWMQGEPNDEFGGEDHIEINFPPSHPPHPSIGKWNDMNNNDNKNFRGFICQK